MAKQLHNLFFHIFLVMPLFFSSLPSCLLHTGPPTKFGLAESLRARMEQQRAVVPTLSVYKASYPLHPISAFCHSRHVSMPKRISSSQHPANHSNEDLALKHRPYRQVSSNPARLLWPLPFVSPPSALQYHTVWTKSEENRSDFEPRQIKEKQYCNVVQKLLLIQILLALKG